MSEHELKNIPKEHRGELADALFILEWSAQKGDLIDGEDQTRLISPPLLGRAGHFADGGRDRVEKGLDLLELLGLVQGRQKISGGGRPKHSAIVLLVSPVEVMQKALAYFTTAALTEEAPEVVPLTNPPVAGQKQPVYYQLPAILVDALAERTRVFVKHNAWGSIYEDGPAVYSPDEQDDLIDAYHLYRWALDNLNDISDRSHGSETPGREVSLELAQSSSVRFRKSPVTRIEAAVKLLVSKGGICCQSADLTLKFFDEVVSSALWEPRSQTHQLYAQTPEQAEHRLLLRLLGRTNCLPALPTEPAKKFPKSVKAVADFKCSFNNVLFDIRKEQIFTEPEIVRKLIEAKLPVISPDDDMPKHFCPRCTTIGVVPEIDTSEGTNYLRFFCDFRCMLYTGGNPILFSAEKDDVIVDRIIVNALCKMTGPDSPPAVPIKRHEFIECGQCALNRTQRKWVYFPEPLPEHYGPSDPAQS